MGARRAVMLAPVGEAWVREAMPAGLAEHLAIEVVVPAGGGGATVDGVADEWAAAIRAGGPEPAIAFGHSMNGTLALATAARHPDAVAGVVAVGSPPALPPDVDAIKAHWDAAAEPARRARYEEHAAGYDAAAAGSDEQVAHWKAADRLRRWHALDLDEELQSRLDDAEGPLDMAWVQAVFASATDTDWPATIAAVRCPVLITLGRSDFLVPSTAWDALALPDHVTIEVFEESGHTAFVEEPDAFVAAVAAWLDRSGQKTA